MTQQPRPAFTIPQTGGYGEVRTSPLQAIIVKPEQALSIKPFGLDVKVLLSRGHRWRNLGPHGMAETR